MPYNFIATFVRMRKAVSLLLGFAIALCVGVGLTSDEIKKESVSVVSVVDAGNVVAPAEVAVAEVLVVLDVVRETPFVTMGAPKALAGYRRDVARPPSDRYRS